MTTAAWNFLSVLVTVRIEVKYKAHPRPRQSLDKFRGQVEALVPAGEMNAKSKLQVVVRGQPLPGRPVAWQSHQEPPNQLRWPRRRDAPLLENPGTVRERRAVWPLPVAASMRTCGQASQTRGDIFRIELTAIHGKADASLIYQASSLRHNLTVIVL